MKLLRLLSAKGEMGNADILRQLGLKDRTNTRQHYVDPACADGLVEYTIPDKPNSRLQKYRLTDKGHSLLAALKEGKK